MGCITSIEKTHTDINYCTIIKPTFKPEYYGQQVKRYFNSLQKSNKKEKIRYSPNVVRYENHPWYEVADYREESLRKCKNYVIKNQVYKYYDTQPFVRTYTTIINYKVKDQPLRLYTEFCFDKEGRISFVEVWSYYFFESGNRDEHDMPKIINRISTSIPTLGDGLNVYNPIFNTVNEPKIIKFKKQIILKS